MYSLTRQDRSGAALQDMLACHAYAFHHNATYGGACGDSPFLSQHKQMILELGLQNVLPHSCPPKNNPNHAVVSNAKYLHEADTSLWTPDWQRFVRTYVEQKVPNNLNLNPAECRIVVHIRRGDVTPCCSEQRYSPNSLYLSLIEKYNPDKSCKVEIYSQSKSFENFEDFASRGYTLHLDGDPMDAARALLTSKVAILSKSSFSMVSAVLRDQTYGKVVYTPFRHSPLKGWDYVPVTFIKDMNQRVKQLRNQNCAAAEKKSSTCDTSGTKNR